MVMAISLNTRYFFMIVIFSFSFCSIVDASHQFYQRSTPAGLFATNNHQNEVSVIVQAMFANVPLRKCIIVKGGIQFSNSYYEALETVDNQQSQLQNDIDRQIWKEFYSVIVRMQGAPEDVSVRVSLLSKMIDFKLSSPNTDQTQNNHESRLADIYLALSGSLPSECQILASSEEESSRLQVYKLKRGPRMTEESIIESGWRTNASCFTGAFLIQSLEEDMIPMEPFQSLPVLSNVISNGSNARLSAPGFNSFGSNLQGHLSQLNMSIFAFISRNVGGNYIAYSRNVPTSTWFRCLENSITSVSEEMALNAMRVSTLIFYGHSIERRFFHDFMPLPFSLVTLIMSKPKAIDLAGAPIYTALRVEQNHSLILAQEAAARALRQEQQQTESQPVHEGYSRQSGSLMQRRITRRTQPADRNNASINEPPSSSKTQLLRRLFLKSNSISQHVRQKQH